MDTFSLLDDRLSVIDVNLQACDSLGYSRDELIGMHPRDFDVGLDEASIKRLGKRIAAGERLTFETPPPAQGWDQLPSGDSFRPV